MSETSGFGCTDLILFISLCSSRIECKMESAGANRAGRRVSNGIRNSEVVQRRKRLGFITPDDGSADLFAHYSAIASSGFKSLQEGQKVTYEATKGPKGMQASNIQAA